LPFRPIVGQPTSASPAARLNIYIDDAGSTGAIINFTPVHFSAADPIVSSSLYFIDFGDGKYATEPSAVHGCDRIGIVKSRLIVVDAFGRMSSNAARYSCMTIEAPFSYWNNSIQNAAAGRSERRLIRFTSRTGASLSGQYFHPEGYVTPITATLTEPNSIRIVLSDGTMVFTGKVIIKDAFNDEFAYGQDRHLILNVEGGSATGMTLDFKMYSDY
jgi:hypothetical protein